MEHIEAIRELLVQGKIKELTDEVRIALAGGYRGSEILNQGLMPAMDIVGQKMGNSEFFIPEVLLRAKAMQSAIDIMQFSLTEDQTRQLGTVAIGTVKGDVHDIGKNLVIIMLKGTGFKVIDLGVNVAVQTFVDTVIQAKPDILGMSAMLTTTMQEMEKVINALKSSGCRQNVKVIVGGAPVNDAWATKIGADAYCRDCAVAVEKAKETLRK